METETTRFDGSLDRSLAFSLTVTFRPRLWSLSSVAGPGDDDDVDGLGRIAGGRDVLTASSRTLRAGVDDAGILGPGIGRFTGFKGTR